MTELKDGIFLLGLAPFQKQSRASHSRFMLLPKGWLRQTRRDSHPDQAKRVERGCRSLAQYDWLSSNHKNIYLKWN
jgi:hypothetical protein